MNVLCGLVTCIRLWGRRYSAEEDHVHISHQRRDEPEEYRVVIHVTMFYSTSVVKHDGCGLISTHLQQGIAALKRGCFQRQGRWQQRFHSSLRGANPPSMYNQLCFCFFPVKCISLFQAHRKITSIPYDHEKQIFSPTFCTLGLECDANERCALTMTDTFWPSCRAQQLKAMECPSLTVSPFTRLSSFFFQH